MRYKHLFLSSFFVGVSFASLAVAADCPVWLTPGFWETAQVQDVQTCLASDRGLTERTETGETPLHLAASTARPETVLALLQLGADVSLTTVEGLTPLHHAARDSSYSAVVSYLLVWGSEVDKRIPPDTCYTGTCADTALHLASDRPNSAPILAALLAGGADPDADDSKGREPLHRATERADLPEIEVLLKAGAAIGETDFDGNTALHVVPQNKTNELAIAQRLIAAGADVDAKRDDNVTPLITVAYYTTNPDVFALLLAHSDAPCHSSKTGTSALTGHAFNGALTKDETYWSLHEKCSQD
ncbi:ankyrin repeat domain-containing protein [Antarctobacter sp.]|uniref:ankyrin repeat domain-containing protein n=1 Tax=Antarctobacter sp. TaxID=1872577 RepID=UPI002B275E2E|nr:ankyrin repeat domain-containing protein [Antarctobacter sp.]